jgi:hypothetical protein
MQSLESLNEGRPYDQQLKPFNFLLTCHVRVFGHPTGVDAKRFHLIAPYDTNPKRWTKIEWIDQYSGQPYRITTEGHHGARGVARVKPTVKCSRNTNGIPSRSARTRWASPQASRRSGSFRAAMCQSVKSSTSAGSRICLKRLMRERFTTPQGCTRSTWTHAVTYPRKRGVPASLRRLRRNILCNSKLFAVCSADVPSSLSCRRCRRPTDGHPV